MKKINFKAMSKKKKILLIAGLIVLIGIIAVIVASNIRSAKSEEAVAAPETATAEVMTIRKTASSKGEIKSALEEKIIPHASYVLEKVSVPEGEAVKEGGTILYYTNGTRMTAPYDCVIKSFNLPDPKKKLTNDNYVEIAGTKVLMMELSVSEDDVMLLKKGAPAIINVEATKGKYNGEVSFVSDIGDYSGGTSEFKTQILFNNDGKIKLGMNGKAKIILATANNAICVPIDAVSTEGNKSYVQVQKGKNADNVKNVEVETGIKNKNYIEIKSGLKEGDTVIVSSGDDMGDSMGTMY